MALLFPDQPVSTAQRRLNWAALLLCSALGIALGLWVAKDCAATTSGYAASYDPAIVFALAVALCVLGLPLLIYWRTRWLGSGLIVAGILSYAAFGIAMTVLLKKDLVAWRHEQLVSIGPDQTASAVVYFREDITDQEVEKFTTSVLMEPAAPQHRGLDFPPFVRQYLRLAPDQANGHRAVALTFRDNAPRDKEQAYLDAIKADSRVETVFLNTAPDSIPANSKHP